MLPEFGAPELLVIAAIALIVVGPKDLPILMRRVGQWVARMRSMAMEFRSSFDELARQSELEELRREVEAMRAAAQHPMAAASEAAGLHDIHAEVSAAHAEIHGALSDAVPTLPYETQPYETAAAPEAAPVAPSAAEGEAAAAEPSKPKRKRTRKTAPDQAPSPPEGLP